MTILFLKMNFAVLFIMADVRKLAALCEYKMNDGLFQRDGLIVVGVFSD